MKKRVVHVIPKTPNEVMATYFLSSSLSKVYHPFPYVGLKRKDMDVNVRIQSMRTRLPFIPFGQLES